ncbi:TPA: hypothetical protein HA278_06865 [Candidatus Woesearchaeota archaeon]|nr:hypothetical protein [Candidatus Woesearchaeota archaeon]|tara:strand:- start:915 stop:1286 length:372 start_codon:yes stop_codon:yes gene_type:complete
MKILFVGEKRSKTAIRMNVTWEDKRLASKQLFDAFESIGIDTDEFQFCNVFEPSIIMIDEAVEENIPIVGMGNIAQVVLNKMGVPHTPMIHPAARGNIRKKQNYTEHVKNVLTDVQRKISTRK